MRAVAEKVERRLARYPEAIALVESGQAPDNMRRAIELLREGRNGFEIAAELGLSKSMVYQLLNDPTGAKNKVRKAKGQRPCVDCGEPCNMDGSRARMPERCSRCARAKERAEAKWRPEVILEAIRRWASEHGGPPRAMDWADSFRRHPDFEKGGWPTATTVAKRFGTFNAAVEAAGFKPVHPMGGQPRKPLTREQLADTAALVQEHGLDGAAKRLGMGVAGVELRVKKFENKPIRRNQVAAPKTAEDIIERELEKQENKANRLREELDEVEKQRDRLKIAREALREPVAA